MKHEAREQLINGRLSSTWATDIIITCERGLAAAQALYCLAELSKAIGAHDASAVDYWNNYNWDADGEHGGIEYETDEHHYHSVWLWCDEQADLPKILYVVAAMVGDGARVEPWCENAFTKTFDYHFNNCFCVGYDAKRGYAQ